MKKRSYLMSLAMLAMVVVVSCSKETIEGSYSRDNSVEVEERDTVKTGTPHDGNTSPDTDIKSGDGMVDSPVVDTWGDGDSADIIVS